MSYILDALKKSEQERGHGNIPDVQTVHSSSLNYRNDKRAYWPYILIVAVILNLLAITYFIIKKENPDKPQIMAQKNEAAEQSETENHNTALKTELPAVADAVVNNNKNIDDTEVLITPAATNETHLSSTSPSAKPVSDKIQPPEKTIAANTWSTKKTENSGGNIIEFYDLPESIKLQLPAIIISAHVYSTNPLLRSIVINNNFMEQGEYVLDDLILYEITSNGAIFDYQGMLFNYGVVSGWQ